MSEVGRTEASIPYSTSTSPVVVDADQERDGSSPEISAKFPSWILICKVMIISEVRKSRYENDIVHRLFSFGDPKL